MTDQSRRLALAKIAGAALSLVSLRSAHAESVLYEYDELGRLKTVTYSNGQVITYSYDAAGNRITTVVQGAPPPPPPSGALTASPATIIQGGASTLTWTSADATSASIDNGVGVVAPASGGVVQVSPTSSTTYTLTLVGSGGSTARQASITVNPPPSFNQTIVITGPGPISLRALADAAGYNGAQNATITFTLATAVSILGAPAGGIAIDTGVWPTSSFAISLALQVSGKVFGGGGAGGPGDSVGGPGGDAVYCRLPIGVVVNAGGEIRGGGGGGGGGKSNTSFPGGGDPFVRGGGGGGGGFPNGPGGAGASGDVSGGAGASGTISGGGAGGVGPGAAGEGGAGGAATAAGAAGTGPGSAGGAAGYAIRKNGHAVNVTNNGTITGTNG